MKTEIIKRVRKLHAEGLDSRTIANRLGISTESVRKAADPNTVPSDHHGYQVHANRIGVPVEEYVQHREAGERWCLYCPSTDGRLGAWHPQREMQPRGQVCKACVRRDPTLKK